MNYTLGVFNGININWIHHFQINLGIGWTNLVPIKTFGNPVGSTVIVMDVQHTYPGV